VILKAACRFGRQRAAWNRSCFDHLLVTTFSILFSENR
jgi:hypothetical protein